MRAENHLGVDAVFEVGIFFDRWRLTTAELFFRINKRVRRSTDHLKDVQAAW